MTGRQKLTTVVLIINLVLLVVNGILIHLNWVNLQRFKDVTAQMNRQLERLDGEAGI